MSTEHLAGKQLHLPYYKLGRSRLEKGKGCFSLQTTAVSGVLSVSRVNFVNRNLQGSCFVSLVRLPWGENHPSVILSYFSPFGKRATFPSKSGFSRKGGTFLMGFKLKKPTAYT